MPLKSEIIFSVPARTFLTFCRTRSVIKTQAELALSASAVSRHLAAFERQIGFTVIDRMKKPYAPTTEGLYFAQVLTNLLKPAGRAQDAFRAKSALRPVLRIGILQTLVCSVGLGLIHDLEGKVGTIRFLSGSSDRLIESFRAKEVDAVVISRTYSDLEGVRRHVLFSEPTVLVLPSSLAGTHAHWSWSQLLFCGLPYIRYWRAGGGKKSQDYFTSVNLNFPDRFEVDHTAVILGLVAQGKGWTLARASQLPTTPELLDRITVLAMPEPVLRRKLYLLADPDLPEAFYRLLLKTLLTQIDSAVRAPLAATYPWMTGSLKLGNADNPSG